jgi:hypothetical protein
MGEHMALNFFLSLSIDNIDVIHKTTVSEGYLLSRVRCSFRLEAKRCEKGSEKNFASKQNKGFVSLVSLRSEKAIFACETK